MLQNDSSTATVSPSARRWPVSTARKPNVMPLSLIGSASTPPSPRSVTSAAPSDGFITCASSAVAAASLPTRSSSSWSRTRDAQRGAAQAEDLAEIGERSPERRPQVVAADQIDRQRLQQLHAARAPRGRRTGRAEAADVVGEHDRDQRVDDERGDARRRLDAERVVRLREQEVERQRADQREHERRGCARRSWRSAAAAGARGRSIRCRAGRAAARARRWRRAARTATPRRPAHRATPPRRRARAGGGGWQPPCSCGGSCGHRTPRA